MPTYLYSVQTTVRTVVYTTERIEASSEAEALALLSQGAGDERDVMLVEVEA